MDRLIVRTHLVLVKINSVKKRQSNTYLNLELGRASFYLPEYQPNLYFPQFQQTLNLELKSRCLLI